MLREAVNGQLWLVVSTDEWNRRDKITVVCAEVAPGEDETDYDVPVTIDEQPHAIWTDSLSTLGLEELEDGVVANAGAEVMEAVDDRLDLMLSDRPRPHGQWPRGVPKRGQFRHVDLQLPGERPKPHIVVSSDSFARDVDHRHVVLVRKGSSGKPPGMFEVGLAGTGAGDRVGKVFCYDIRTMPVGSLIARSGDPHVAGPVQSEIQRQVRLMLGLAAADD